MWKISLRFFSPPEKPSLTERCSIASSTCSSLRLLLDERHEVHGVELLEALLLALGVERRLEEVGVVHAGNLDRILERHEHAFAGALVGIHVEQILAVVEDLAAGDFVAGMPGQRAGERALARAVGPHDGVHFARVHREVDAAEDLACPPTCTFRFLTSSIDIDPSSSPLRSNRPILPAKCPAASALRRRTPSAARGTLPCRSR